MQLIIFTMKIHFEKYIFTEKVGFFILGGNFFFHERLDRITGLTR